MASNVKLFPATDTHPRRSQIPLARARRWLAPFDDDLVPTVEIFITSQAFVRACAHAGTDLDHEVGGGLVGSWHRDEENIRSYILVEGILPARYTRQGSAFLTFTQDTLVAMNDDLEARFPDKLLVGWFHTHPRMGVFLSSYDQWLHEHFFPEPWQVALVIEPHTAVGGFFVRQRDLDLDRHRYFGFYEVLAEEAGPVVHWRNLRMEPDDGSQKAEVEHD